MEDMFGYDNGLISPDDTIKEDDKNYKCLNYNTKESELIWDNLSTLYVVDSYLL